MVSRDANELMALPARSSNRGYDCARRRTTTTPRVTRENRPATTENYKTISGRGAAEVAEYGSDPGGDPTDRHRRGWLANRSRLQTASANDRIVPPPRAATRGSLGRSYLTRTLFGQILGA